MNDKNENLVLEHLWAIRGTLETQEQLPTTVDTISLHQEQAVIRAVCC